MVKKNRKPAKKASSAPGRKRAKPRKPQSTRHRSPESIRAAEKRSMKVREKEPLPEKQPIRESGGFKTIIETIEGTSVIGDVLVGFPRTRDVLMKHGLRLDVEDAGDIYMTLDAFAALRGLDIGTLVEELVKTSKEPPLQAAIPPLVASPPS